MPIRILYIVGGTLSRGGIESYIMNYYRNINKSRVQIDFIIHGYEKGVYDDEIISLGGKIYNVPLKKDNLIKNISEIKKIFKTGKYKIVHCHMDGMNSVVLKIAKDCGIPVRISHSHNSEHLTKNKVKWLIHEFLRKNISKYATHLFACSEKAGKWLYGKDAVDNDEVLIIKNAIELDKFKFNQENRKFYRDKYKLNDSFVVGTIGRIHFQKNYEFLIDVFYELHKINIKSKLVIIGDGELKPKLKEKIKLYGLEEDVWLLGVCSNINELINMFDIFVMPSLFEGLPIVSVEAQTNGLRCLFADTITKQAKIIDKVEYLSLQSDKKYWAEYINKYSNIEDIREGYVDVLSNGGYDIKLEAEKLEDLYIKLLK